MVLLAEAMKAMDRGFQSRINASRRDEGRMCISMYFHSNDLGMVIEGLTPRSAGRSVRRVRLSV
jgi:hypothetical protein